MPRAEMFGNSHVGEELLDIVPPWRWHQQEISGDCASARLCTRPAMNPFGKCAAKGIANGARAVACIRQRDIQIVTKTKGRKGHVLHTRFLGETALMEIGVEGLDEHIFARVRESRGKDPGSEIGIAVDPKDILVFASGEG
jgi:iron(III) transport system ATP-binding protein